MSISLITGEPYQAAIISTEPKQLRFASKFDQQYTIRISYVPMPPQIESMDDDLYVPESLHQLTYLKFCALVAEDMGYDDLAAKFGILYDRRLAKDKALAKSEHLTVHEIPYSPILK